MVADMSSRMSLFVAGPARLSSKESIAAMLIGDMDISRLMVYVQQVEEEKLSDREEFKNRELRQGMSRDNKRVMLTDHPSNKNRRDLLYHLLVHLYLRTKVSTIVRILKLSLCILRYGQNGHFIRECPKKKQGNGNGGNRAQSSLVAPPDRAAPRGATSGTSGGTNCLYAINCRLKQEDSLDVVIGMIQVFDFTVYALLDQERVYLL
ncbi:hypothetical protein R3W88_016511 [Solanum pinnatisectum]|uniref:CCHC-type domain-containing protein n=1 Tax=Solanum pinnatisectum TaxID=50273 RepID=A0AAV9KYC5_9SOLN|nr:hypothetical protein R3W88_016511 [Solanum pinnatisectum]